ncbi:MAG TPA: hypothetical protein VII52_03125 [Gemmatimonadaceae bacterium]
MKSSRRLAVTSACDARDTADELSDSDLEHVVGGLCRAWRGGGGDAPLVAGFVPASLSVTSLVAIDARQRVPA